MGETRAIASVHSFIRKRSVDGDESIDLHYMTTGRHLQLDIQQLAQHLLPKPDLLRGYIHCPDLATASKVAHLKLNGLYTREVSVPPEDTFYAEHPEFIGPPRIQLKAPRPARSSAGS